MFFMLAIYGQAPTQLNYQGVARKANGHGISSENIKLRLSIHDGTATGPVVYQETRSVTTNAFGLFNVAIGSPGATGVIGSVGLVNWATGNKYLQVEMDPDGGSNFANMGTSQLLSVPYALYSGSAPPVGPAGGDLTGTYPNPTVARIRGVNVNPVAPLANSILGFDGINWTPTSLATHPDNYWRFLAGNIYNANGGNVGIGLNAPTERLDVNGNLKTLGFKMPTGAGLGKVLVSDAIGVGAWSSTFAASSIVLPYKDSASSETAHIFHIIQTSTTSPTGALYGVTRSQGANAMGVGGLVSSVTPGAFSAGVRGENMGTGGSGIGVYGSQNGSGRGVFGTTPSGVGVYGSSNSFYGVYGTSSTSSGVFGQSNSGAGYLAGVFGYATNAGGNGAFGYATRALGFGSVGIADSSAGVYGQTNAPNFDGTSNYGAAVYGLATSGGLGVYSTSFGNSAGKFEITNVSNASTTLDVRSTGTGRAIFAQSNLPGPIFGGVIDALTTVYGSNGIFSHATKGFGWGVVGLSDSSVGTAGIGYRPGSVGIFGQGYSGTAAQFLIDNSFLNTSNAVEISNSQSGKGLLLNMTNASNTANGIEINHDGSGIGIYSNSNLGISSRIENTNAANNSTTLDVRSVGQGRAIFAQSNLPGPIFGGVVDALSTVNSSNTIFGRATRPLGWGVVGFSDSSVGTAGVGYRLGSVGIFGQGYSGIAAQFLIDNSFANSSNTVEVLNTQSGKGIMVNLTNAGNTNDGIEVNHSGSGYGIYANSHLGIAGRFENINPTNGSDLIYSTTNGLGRAMSGFITNPTNSFSTIRGETNGTGNGVAGVGTNNNTYNAGVYGFHDGTLGNGVIGWGTKALTYGVIGHADSAVGVYGESGLGNAAYFLSTNSNGAVPALYTQTNGLSNIASFYSANPGNSADAVMINRNGTGRSLMVSMGSFSNLMNFYDVVNTGKQTARIEGNSGLGLLAHAGGTFTHTFGSQRVGIGVYGQADSLGSQFNYGIVGNAKGGSLENAGVIGWIGGDATGSNRNAAIYGVVVSDGPGTQYAGLFEGDVQVTGTLSKGAGSFKIDHPQDPTNKYLVHSFVESPDMMNVYNGNVITDADGNAVVDLPGYFEAENKDFKYQLTVIGQFAQAIIGEEIRNNQFIIRTDKPNVKVSWQVTGVRNDPFAQRNRIVAEVEKAPKEKGKYLYPELYGQSREQGITFMKTGLPGFQQGSTSNISSRSSVTENKAQDQVNRQVEQKRRMLNPTEQGTAQLNKMNVPLEENKVIKVSEKASTMSALANTTSQSKAEEKEETKKIQVPTEKIKQLAASVDDSKVAQPQSAQKTNNATASSEKEKSLSKPKVKVPEDQQKETPKKD